MLGNSSDTVVQKVFPARYLADSWHWCSAQELEEVIGRPMEVLLDEYANVGGGWNLTVLMDDNSRHLWTTIIPGQTPSFMVPLGWAKALTDYAENFSLPLMPVKQTEFLYQTFRKQGYVVVRIKPEQRTAKLAYLNPLVAELKETFPTTVQTIISSYNDLGLWEVVDMVIYNSERWSHSLNDRGSYLNGLDPAYRYTGSIRLDRRPLYRAEMPFYLHPVIPAS